ncbi:phosphate transporter [Chloropicon primus]|nr:phosphate transporter [Chloropicon primus]
MVMNASSPYVFSAGCIFAALFAYGLGANDVGNAFGTSIGSGALTMRVAVVIASVMEVVGAVTLGAGVADTLTRHISYLEREDCWDCHGSEAMRGLYEIGMVYALASGSAFLLAATLFGLPVSSTHTIVGAVLGMTAVATHVFCIKWLWPGLMKIVASWFVSPLLAGAISVLLQFGIRRLVLEARTPLRRAYVALPVLSGSTIAVLAMLILYQQSSLALWVQASIALGSGLAVWGLVQLLLLSRVKRHVESSSIEMKGLRVENSGGGSGVGSAQGSLEEGEGEEENGEVEGASDAKAGPGAQSEEANLLSGGATEELERAKMVFMYLQILTATLKSFAHGANDVANAAGPFAAVAGLYAGQDPCSITTTIWVLLLCGAGIVLGLSISGHHVIKTIGKDLTAIDFPTGFSIELGSTMSVVLASCTGMPVSSTHCQVGSVIFIGMYENGAKHVKWSMLNKIIASWVVTVPVSALCAGGLTYVTLLFIN